MSSGGRCLAAALAAGALILGSCRAAPLDSDAPVADDCPRAAGAVAAPAGALTARDAALPPDRFPLCGYEVTSEEATGTAGWSRMFRPIDAAKANFAYVMVQTFTLGAGDSAAAFVARQKPETWSWGGGVPEISRLPAEVVGDAAAAYQAFFGGSRPRRYIYLAGSDGYAFVLLAEPSRAGVNDFYPAALQRLLSIARSELAFWDALALAARSSGGACNVMYDGTWTGQATYKYEKESHQPDRAVPQFSGAVSFTFTMRCTSLTADAVVLRVTQASSPHPYFGAPTPVGVQGAATLPRNLPAVAARPSDPYTISIIFPNGSIAGFLLVTVPTERADQVAMAPGGDAGVRQMGWTAGNPTAGAAAAVFPFDPEVGFAVILVDKGWSFAKQSGAR